VKTTLTKVYKDVTTTTTITPRTKNTYADGTEEIVNGTASETQAIVKTFVSESENSTTEIVDQVTENTTTTETDSGQVVSITTITTTYTDLDPNLGTRTVGYNTDKTTYETDEYLGQTSRSYEHVNASSAYSKGWTGNGSIVAVADTGYDTDHTEFDGQVVATRDYYGNGIQDNHGHGSHVLGTIVAKKDGTGTHGVAFDAKAVVIKIGDQRSVSLDNAASGFSWAADQGAIVGNLSANSNYDNWFKNSIEKLDDNTFKTNSTSYDYENGVYYNRMTPDQWKTATDKGMVLVNSAGNQGLDISAMPGWFATETDADGNLVLGGKVLIVGGFNYHSDTDTPIIDTNSNKAGHLCRVVVDNACTDSYKTSDFYVLAPWSTKSTNNDGGYSAMSGTSMAAPVVTGQIAILHQMWPHMKGENLVKLVTTTADKSFTGYDVHIHGQGVVDFDESTKPQGAIGIPTTGRVDGSISSISNTRASGSGSIGSAISNVQIMVLDDFDRDYYMNLGNSFTVQDNRKYSDVEMLVDNKNTFLPHQQMYGSFAQGGQYDLAKNYNFGLYTGENGNGDYSLNVGKDFYLNDKFKVKTSVGYMSEQETWLGNTSEGVLAVGDNNDTQSANIGVAYQLGNNVLTLDYSKGKTDINTVDGSLIKSFSDVETESYRLAYEIHKDTHTTFGWSFSLPSHITSGSMDLEVAESVNLDGTINYTKINSDLAQGTKEKNIGFFYSKSPAEMFDTGLNFTAEYRTDKSGVANNDGVEMAVTMVKKFAGSCKFLWMKNPKCFDENGNMKSNLFGTSVDNATKHGLVYDLKTDKFIPIKK
jgi:subtilisin family serine protease